MKQKILLTSSSYVTTRPSKQAWRLSLLRNFILTLLLTVAQGAWAGWNGETYTASSDENPTGTINVSTATLTIQSGVTVTVTGSSYVTITASDAVASGNCGATGHESEVMWVLTGTSPNCTLTISGTGAMADFADASAQTWAAYRASIKTVTIYKDITSISSYAFDGCTNLTSVTLNSNPTIGTDAFSSASVTMYLTANEGATGEYWTTFYNENYSFEADEDTQLFKAALSGTSLTLTELTTDKIVTNGNAVILKSTASPIVMTLTTAGSNDFSGNSLQGVSDPEGLTADDPSTTYVLNKKSSGVGFYKLKAGKTAGVGKAYLTYSGGGASAREFFGFSETTSVDEVRSTKEDAPGNVFDLQGRRVSQPSKGLYIVRSAAERSQGKNGKKVFINK